MLDDHSPIRQWKIRYFLSDLRNSPGSPPTTPQLLPQLAHQPARNVDEHRATLQAGLYRMLQVNSQEDSEQFGVPSGYAQALCRFYQFLNVSVCDQPLEAYLSRAIT